MEALIRAKGRALLIHLGISGLIFLPILYLIWVHWFPPPLFFTDGGWQGVRIMLVVDMVIGPSLTFLIFNPAKTRRAIAFDFSCIALVQAAALLYGYVSVESKRIQAVAFYEGAFQAVTKDDFAKQQIDPAGWEKLGLRAPYWVYVRPFRSGAEKAGATTFEITQHVLRHELHFLYEPLADRWAAVESESAGQAATSKFAPLCEGLADTLAAEEGSICVGLHGYFAPAAIVFDRHGSRLAWNVGEPYD